MFLYGEICFTTYLGPLWMVCLPTWILSDSLQDSKPTNLSFWEICFVAKRHFRDINNILICQVHNLFEYKAILITYYSFACANMAWLPQSLQDHPSNTKSLWRMNKLQRGVVIIYTPDCMQSFYHPNIKFIQWQKLNGNGIKNSIVKKILV